MILDHKNQNDILSSELSNSYDIEYIFNDKPINRTKTKPKVEEKSYLLVELRKEVPTTRLQAQEHWQNVKVIAIQSDPNLGTKIDRVISMINPYYDWLENQPGVNATEAEFFNWIIEGNISGALNYTEEIGKFQNDALLTVIIRMDAALSIVS